MKEEIREQLSKRLNLLPCQMRLWAALTAFKDEGGTREQWIAAYDAFTAMHTPQSVGARKTLSDDHNLGAAPTAVTNNGGGHGAIAAKSASHIMPPPVAPSASRLAAIAEAKAETAKSVFERILTHTGRQWGNVQYCEYDSMAEDGEFAQALKKHIGQLKGSDRLKYTKELITARAFIQLHNKVRKHA